MAGSIFGFDPSASFPLNSLFSPSFSDAPVEQDLGFDSPVQQPMTFGDSFDSGFSPLAPQGLPALSPMDMFGAGPMEGFLGLPSLPDPLGILGGDSSMDGGLPDPLGFLSPSQPSSPFGPVAQPAISSPFRPTDPFSGSSSFGGPETSTFQPAPTRQNTDILDARNGHRGRHSGIGAKPTLPPGGDY